MTIEEYSLFCESIGCIFTYHNLETGIINIDLNLPSNPTSELSV